MEKNDITLPKGKDARDFHSIEAFIPPETVEMVARYGAGVPADLALDVDMAVLFSDMRGFTALAEEYSSREVYAVINASLAIQTRLVLKHGGSVNKFLGDGLLACFSGEHRSIHALECAMEMLDILPKRDKEHDLPPCPVGFGISEGSVVLGLLGSEKRKEFAVIGDVVNTAARLCGIASPFQALLTEQVLHHLPEDIAECHCRFFRNVTFKGKSIAANVYRVHTDDAHGSE